MNEPLTWEAIARMVVSVCAGLLVLFIAISYFRKRQARRMPLLAGALIMVPVAFFWTFVFLWRDLPAWVFTTLAESLSWLGASGGLLFYITLLLIAMDRRNRARRIEELEAILRDRETIANTSQTPVP